MAAGVCVERGDADEAVHTLFAAEVAIGVVAADLEGDGLNARFVAVKQIQQLDSEAHLLAVAGIHAVEHGRPVLRFRSARARVEGQHRVVVVVVAAHEGFQLQRVGMLFERRQLIHRFGDGVFVLLFFRHFEHDLDIIGGRKQFFVVFEFAFEVGNLLVDLRGVIRVIPEFGLIHFLGQLIQLFADMVNVEGIARGKQGFANLCQFAAILGNIYERHV